MGPQMVNPNAQGQPENLNKTVSEAQVFGYGPQPAGYSPAAPQPAPQGAPQPTAYGPATPQPQSTVGNFGPASVGAQPAAGDGTRPCPKCGYPLRPGTDKCPNCKFQLSGVAHTDYQPSNDSTIKVGPRRPTRIDGDDDVVKAVAAGLKGGGVRGTINPYMMMGAGMEQEPYFTLKPVQRVNERRTHQAQEFEGSSVVLNRNNTDPGNPSITSHEQAVITNENGRWFIQDKSEQKTTFVLASGKTPLHDGDLILLGNRLFEFHD